jgi:hypothetical protein
MEFMGRTDFRDITISTLDTRATTAFGYVTVFVVLSNVAFCCSAVWSLNYASDRNTTAAAGGTAAICC